MSNGGKQIGSERAQTDESLRIERANTDRALLDQQAILENDADLVVQRAREAADAVLVTARDKADEQLADGAAPPADSAAVADQRTIEDDALQNERAAADESLRREREESAQALSTLLPLERNKTDRYLLTERVRSDNAVSNRDDFLGIVSHDLRNLLSGIVINATMLAKKADSGDAGNHSRAATDRIQRYAARMNRLIGDLVDVASIEAGKLAFAPVSGDWTALLVEAVETFRATASERGVVLEIEGPAVPLPGEFDHDRMLQLLANLITNAIKFTEPGGRIVVRGALAGDQVRVSVTDSGAGIAAEMLESIFERFWQAGKNDRSGLGLGLYISRCIVEGHHGRIWAESTLGKGTTLAFTIPRSAQEGPGRSA